MKFSTYKKDKFVRSHKNKKTGLDFVRRDQKGELILNILNGFGKRIGHVDTSSGKEIYEDHKRPVH